MKFYSEITKKLYSSEEEALKDEERTKNAEKVEQEKKARIAAERAADAKAIEQAYKEASDANEKYLKLKNEFIKKYGSYHMSYVKSFTPTSVDLFDFLFK